MATKPSAKPNWATNDVVDEITGNDNKTEPSEEFKLSGLKSGQPCPRVFLNYQFNNIREWIDWAEEEIETLILDGATTTLQAVYPVGSYYMNNSDSTNPATLFGFGTWVAVEGKFIVGVDSGDTDFDGAGEEGGGKTHAHTDTFAVGSHALTLNEIPSHTHQYIDRYFVQNNPPAAVTNKEATPANYNSGWGPSGSDQNNNYFYTYIGTTDSAGSGQAHTHTLTGVVQGQDHLPPYRAAYIWYRTA